MEEKNNDSQFLYKSKNYNSPSLNRVRNYSKINDSDDEGRNFTQKSIRNKLDNAFTDLHSLRNALKSIKYKTENPIVESTKNLLNRNNRSRHVSPNKDNYVSSANNSYSRDYDGNGGSRSRSNSNDRLNRNRSYLNSKNDRYEYFRTPRENSRTIFANLRNTIAESKKILENQKQNLILSPTRSIHSNYVNTTSNNIAEFNSSYHLMNQKQQHPTILRSGSGYHKFPPLNNNYPYLNRYSNINNSSIASSNSKLPQFNSSSKQNTFSKKIETSSNFKKNDHINVKEDSKDLNQESIHVSTNSSKVASTVSFHHIKEENQSLKLANAVLSKSNLDLKNQVRILHIELSACSTGQQNSIKNKTSEDQELALFIQALKSSLSTALSTNEELTGLFENLQKKNADLSKEILILREQKDLFNKELEGLTRKFNGNRNSLEDLHAQLLQLESERASLLIHKNDFEEKYKIAEEKITNLMSINESHLKSKNDQLEVIENLKATVDVLRRNNGETESSQFYLKQRIEELEALVQEKVYNSESLQNKLEAFEADKEYCSQELALARKELKQKDRFVEDLQQKYHEVSAESEKAKAKIEALSINIEERDETIQNLKSSISFITNTIDDYKQDYDKIRLQTDGASAEKSKLVQENSILLRKAADLHQQSELLKKDKDLLQQRSFELESELNGRKLSLSKLNFQVDVLEQKLQKVQTQLELAQEELRVAKLNKVNEDFQADIAKASEERTRRVKELEKTIEGKNKQIEILQHEVHDVKLDKNEKVTELQELLSSKTKDEKELEFKMNAHINDFKNEIEISKQEILMFKAEKEKENLELINTIGDLKDEYALLEQRYKTCERNFQEYAKSSSKYENSIIKPDSYITTDSNESVKKSNFKNNYILIKNNDSDDFKNNLNNSFEKKKVTFVINDNTDDHSSLKNNNSSSNAAYKSENYQYSYKKDGIKGDEYKPGQTLDAEEILRRIRDTAAKTQVNPINSNTTYISSSDNNLGKNVSTYNSSYYSASANTHENSAKSLKHVEYVRGNSAEKNQTSVKYISENSYYSSNGAAGSLFPSNNNNNLNSSNYTISENSAPQTTIEYVPGYTNTV